MHEYYAIALEMDGELHAGSLLCDMRDEGHVVPQWYHAPLKRISFGTKEEATAFLKGLRWLDGDLWSEDEKRKAVVVKVTAPVGEVVARVTG